jgi:parallel beta-helix repeat protein
MPALMGGSNNASYTIHPYERERLNWMTCTEVSSNQSIPLPDYVTTGSALKLQVGASVYVYVTNHQEISQFDIPNGNYSAPGIYITTTNGTTIRMLSAKGNYNWEFAGDIQNPWDVPGKTIPVFKTTSENRTGQGYRDRISADGRSDYLHAYYDDNGNLRTDIHRCFGTNEDYFDDDTDNFMISQYSNPSILAYGGNYSNRSVKINEYYGGTYQVQIGVDYNGTVISLPPFRPLNFNASIINIYPYLSWDLNTEPDMAVYEIWKKNSPSSSWFLLNSTVNPYYLDNNNTYPEVYYKIRAVDDTDKKSIFTKEVYLNPATVAENAVWSGTFTVPFNVTVASGATLTISADSELRFTSAGKLTIDGTLNAQGTSSQGITFMSANANPSPGAWYGIRINGAATFDYCTMKHATYGVNYYTGSTGSISNSDLLYNRYGVYAYKSNPNVQNCQIHHNSYDGVNIGYANNYGTAQILNNTIYNTGDGIQLHQSSPDIRGNEIYNNYIGIYCVSSSSPHLGKIGYYGNNHIHDNSNGIRALSSCNPHLGEDGCQVNGGWNQITNSNNYHVWADYYSHVRAENNWWGSNPPQSYKFYSDPNSSIDYTPYLTSPPAMGLLAGGSPEEQAYDDDFGGEESTGDFTAQNYYDDKWTLQQKLIFARQIIYLGDIEFSESICREIIATCPDSALSFMALDILWEASRNAQAKEGSDLSAFHSYLQELTRKKERKEIYGYAEIILAAFEGKNGVAHLDKVYNEYKETFLAEAALLHKFMYYYHDEENMEAAKQVLSQMESEFPESESTGIAREYFDSAPIALAKASQPDKSAGESAALLPLEYALFANFPNPFNPLTTIKYALPKSSRVQGTVYNAIGQKIKTFPVADQPAGYHSLIWNGRNEQGLEVPSGIYILNFAAGSGDEVFVKSIKMILLR